MEPVYLQVMLNGTCVPPSECPCSPLSLLLAFPNMTLDVQEHQVPPGSVIPHLCNSWYSSGHTLRVSLCFCCSGSAVWGLGIDLIPKWISGYLSESCCGYRIENQQHMKLKEGFYERVSAACRQVKSAPWLLTHNISEMFGKVMLTLLKESDATNDDKITER